MSESRGKAADLRRISEALMDFVNVPTWEQSKLLVTQKKDLLLSEAADEVLSGLLRTYAADPQFTCRLEDHRKLLRRCRAIGIEAAFEDRLRPETATLSPDVRARLAAVKSQQEYEQLRREHPEIQIMDSIATQQAAASGDYPGLPAEADKLLAALKHQTALHDMPRRIALTRKALLLVDREKQPTIWAFLQLELARGLSQSLSANWEQNLEQAIKHCKLALEVYTRESYPIDWATTHNNMGTIYLRREREGEGKNIERAISHLEQALEIRSRDVSPQHWASTQANLGSAYRKRCEGDPKVNSEQAIHYFKQAMDVYTYESAPYRWAGIQCELGRTFQDRKYGDAVHNFEIAVQHYYSALAVYTRERFPIEWAQTHQDIASIWTDRKLSNPTCDCEEAMRHYIMASEVFVRKTFPKKWAAIQTGLARGWSRHAGGSKSENVEQSIRHWNRALTVLTPENSPKDWAVAQVNLAALYAERPVGPREENIERSISLTHLALKVLNPTSFLHEWSLALNNLAIAYRRRISGVRADNIKLAIQSCQQVLEVVSPECDLTTWATAKTTLAAAYRERPNERDAENIEEAIHQLRKVLNHVTWESGPREWAMALAYLSDALVKRIKGDRRKSVEEAIRCCEEVLSALDKNAYPDEWASCHNNLGVAYQSRTWGDRVDNLQQAIHHYRMALEIHTRGNGPESLAGTHLNLGTAYVDLPGADRTQNIEEGIVHFRSALRILTRDDFPKRWAHIQNSLGATFIERAVGERSRNVEIAIRCYRRALSVITRDTLPADWAMTQSNLGIAFTVRERGDPVSNAEKAIFHFTCALQVRSRKGSPREWSTTHQNMGTLYANWPGGNESESWQKAVYHLRLALSERDLERFPVQHRRTQISLGLLFMRRQDWGQAHEAFKGAITAGEFLFDLAYTEPGRQAEVRDASLVYAANTYCLVRMDRIGEALACLESGKARLLASALTLDEARISNLPSVQSKVLQRKRSRVRDLEMEMRLSQDIPGRREDVVIGALLQEARTDLATYVNELSSVCPDLERAHLQLSQIVSLVPQGGALVAPFVMDEGCTVFIVPHGADALSRLHVIEISDLSKKELHNLLVGDQESPGWMLAYLMWGRHKSGDFAEKWRAFMRGFMSRLWSEFASYIHCKLLELGIEPGGRVIVSPQGGIGLLPLHAAARKTPNGTRYFLQDFTVSYIPGAGALRICLDRIRLKTSDTMSLLAIANPIDDLRYAMVECEGVAEAFPGLQIQIMTRDEATKSSVLAAAPHHSHLHFAGHGYYGWGQDIEPHLLLANAERLTISEIISNLDLHNTRLVTLSACETGIIDLTEAPDEFVGLPNAILQAGSAGVISTLWAVDDRATSLLMQRFYDYHVLRGLSPAAALRESQLWLCNATRRDIGSHYSSYLRLDPVNAQQAHTEMLLQGSLDDRPFENPYYWAAFALSGV